MPGFIGLLDPLPHSPTAGLRSLTAGPVSYTHLTLPTILLV